ncbi:MAG: DegT/DnrJ/EryC1/StrS family aminotransferase [Phycisphaerae bacterium]|nr:DegT/DnrJ/EryC1/StrS family aminotransferase [Phycisphaerae bacterium]
MARVLAGGRYILGPETDAFEREFAAYLGVTSSVGVANGTDALHVALRALGVGPGHEVVTVAHTAVATVSAIELAGATPVLVDIQPDSYTLDPAALEKAITPRTRAVIAVHLYGQPADLDAIGAICKPRGIRVVEDCAQCHGALWHGKRTGSIGDIAAFSFYPTKNLGAIGDGGAVATSDPDLARNCRLLREYGWARRYISDVAGFNTRLDELQSAVLRVKLAALDADNDRRRALAEVYRSRLAGVDGLTLPTERAGARHVYHLFAVLVQKRDRVLEALKSHGVLAGIHYPVPIHLQPAYAGRTARAGALPVTERVAEHELSLPMYPELSPADAARVADALRECCEP